MLTSEEAVDRFLDAVNTDSLADGDTFDTAVTLGTGSGTLTITAISSEIVSSGQTNDVWGRINSASSSRLAPAGASVRVFWPFAFGSIGSGIPFYFPATVSRFSAYVSENTYATNGTLTVRRNGVNATGSISVTAGVTGIFKDVAHSDDFDSTDNLTYGITGGTSGSVSILMFACQMRDNSRSSASSAVVIF